MEKDKYLLRIKEMLNHIGEAEKICKTFPKDEITTMLLYKLESARCYCSGLEYFADGKDIDVTTI